MCFYQHSATRSHSQPLEWPQVAASGRSKRVAASGRKWPLQASGRKWPQAAAPSEWPQVAAPSGWPQVAASGRSKRVAASGRKWPLPASGRKWLQVAAPSEWPQVAASGRFRRFQFPPSKQPPWELGSLMIFARFPKKLSQILWGSTKLLLPWVTTWRLGLTPALEARL